MITPIKFSDAAVQNCARSAVSRHADLWPCVSDEVRDALLDSSIMDQIRAASCAGGNAAFSAEDIIAFREKVAETLAEGISLGRIRRAALRFDRDR